MEKKNVELFLDILPLDFLILLERTGITGFPSHSLKKRPFLLLFKG
jgi:hypothetical protein